MIQKAVLPKASATQCVAGLSSFNGFKQQAVNPLNDERPPLSRKALCPVLDSNQHNLAVTTPSRWRVYQFHQLGKDMITIKNKPLVPKTGFEPAHLSALPPESSASTNFAIWASKEYNRTEQYRLWLLLNKYCPMEQSIIE